LRILRHFLKKAVLLEAGAAILLFGSLAHHPELEQHAARAFEELRVRGYEIPADSDPVRVYPANTAGSFSSSHAGGWRPGVISLRENPQGSAGPEVFLRHELMHDANFRTCGGKLPVWAEEAAAMSFSGELAAQSPSGQPNQDDLEYLRRRLRIGARLDQEGYRALSQLVAAHGWPSKPCAVSEDIEKSLGLSTGSADAGFSTVLMNLTSGQVLEAKGDLNTRYPPGSLLKIPYAAALRDASSAAIGEELAASDTTRLLRRKGSLDLDRYRFLISVVKDAPLGQSVPSEQLAAKDERFWRRYVGERAEDGGFPLESSLPELALVLRSCLLYRPDYFTGLSQNGVMEGSTLYAESEPDKRVLGKLQALAKTGTVSDARGHPLIGHLMVAWPAEAPVYLAVFRGFGCTGAGNLRRAARLLEEWSSRYPVELGRVRVRLLTLVPRASWEVLDACPSFSTDGSNGWTQRVSTCGRFRILSAARGSRSERFVAGVLQSSPDGQKVVLETDPETYADAVMDAEAQDLQAEARKALRAVIVWNGTHGGARHADTASLCDSTHCMVFRGSLAEKTPGRASVTDRTLVRQLYALTAKKGLDWLPFSKGGVEKWEKQVSAAELQSLVKEPAILEVRRERTRRGDVMVHLTYPENEETVGCEIFRNRLKLLSCPDMIRYDESRSTWLFAGMGAGHGQGLSLERVRVLAEAGKSAAAILADAYD